MSTWRTFKYVQLLHKPIMAYVVRILTTSASVVWRTLAYLAYKTTQSYDMATFGNERRQHLFTRVYDERSQVRTEGTEVG
jgi:hypothetical protein